MRRQRFVARCDPLQILLVFRVGGVEGDEGVVREALDAGCSTEISVRNKLIHGHSSADAVNPPVT